MPDDWHSRLQAVLQGSAPGWDLWLERLRALEAEVFAAPELCQLLDPGDSPGSAPGAPHILAPPVTALERRERLLEELSRELTESARQQAQARESQNQEFLLKSEDLQGQLVELRSRLSASEDERRRQLQAMQELVGEQVRQAHGRDEQMEERLSEQDHRIEIQLGEIKDLTVTLREKELLCKIQDQQNKGLLGRLGKASQALQKLYRQGGQALRARDEAQARVRDLETTLLCMEADRGRLDQVQARLEELNLELELSQAHRDDLERLIDKQTVGISEREARIVSLQGAQLGAHQGWEEEIQNLRLERDDLASRGEETRLQLERTQDALLKLGAEAGQAVAQRDASQQELEQLRLQLHKRELELSQQGDDYRQQLTAHSLARQDWEALREEQSRLVQQGQQRLVTLEEEHSSQRQALSERCRQLCDQLSQLRLDRDQLASGCEASRLQLKRTRQAFVQLRDKASQALAQRDAHQVELEQRLSQELPALCQQVQQLQHQLQQRDDELHQQGQHHQQALERLSALESEQISWHQEKGGLGQLVLSLQAEMQRLENPSTRNDLQVALTTLEEEHSSQRQSWEEETRALQIQRANLVERVSHLEVQLLNQQQDWAASEAASHALSERCRQLCEQLAQLRLDRDQLASGGEANQLQLQRTQQAFVQLRAKASQALAQRDAHQVELEQRLRQELPALCQQVQQLQRQLQQRDDELHQQGQHHQQALERLGALESEQIRWHQEKGELRVWGLQLQNQLEQTKQTVADLQVDGLQLKTESLQLAQQLHASLRAKAQLSAKADEWQSQLLQLREDAVRHGELVTQAQHERDEAVARECRLQSLPLEQLQARDLELRQQDNDYQQQLAEQAHLLRRVQERLATLEGEQTRWHEERQALQIEQANLVEGLQHQLQQRDDELHQQGENHQQTLAAHALKCQAWEAGSQEQARLLQQAQERLAALESEQTRWHQERGELRVWGQQLQHQLDQTSQTVTDLQVDGLQIKSENDKVAQARDLSEQQVASLKSVVRSLQEQLLASSQAKAEQEIASEVERMRQGELRQQRELLEQRSAELGEALAQLECAQRRLQERGETIGQVAFLQPPLVQPTPARLESDGDEGLLRLPDLRRGGSHYSIPLSLPSFATRREDDFTHSTPLLPGRLGATRPASAESLLLPSTLGQPWAQESNS